MSRYYIKSIRKIALGLIFLMIMSSCVGCISGTDRKEDENEAEREGVPMEFTERQIKILELEGLPTDPDKLEGHQYSAIMEIEARLSYMDKKYGKEHEYDSYIEEGVMNRSELRCFEKDNPIRIISVWKEEDGYHDDYNKKVASEIYSDHLNGYLAEKYGDRFFATAKVVNTYEGEASLESILEEAQVFCTINFYESDCDSEELTKRTNDLLEWIDPENNGILGAYETYIMPDDFFNGINIFNNDDKHEEFHMKELRQIVLYEDGTWIVLD